MAEDPPYDTPLTFGEGTEARTYRLAVPDTYDKDEPAPLVLNLHGAGSNAAQQSVYSELPSRAAERGMITITPDGIDGRWEYGATGPDDQYLDDLVQSVEDGYCIDRDQVHAAGISLGAWKATNVVCQHADRYASVALVAENVHPGDCPPMPVIAFHGTGDTIVPYGEGADPGVVISGDNGGLPGARPNLAAWAEAGGCDPEKDISKIGEDVELWSYRACDPGIDVDFYTIIGGDHTWPGADIQVIGATTQTIDATDLALDFFESHPRS